METAQLFFELIRYAIKGDKLSDETMKGVSEEQLISLLNLSKEHDCAHLVSHALYQNNLISKDQPIYDKFVYEQSLAVFRYENINYELDRVCEFLEQNCIEHIPLKGSVIRSLYPEPWMRTSCDVDILVKREDVDKTIKLFAEKYGCKIEHLYDYEVSIYTPSNVHVELHFGLVAERESQFVAQVLDDVWELSTVREGRVYGRTMLDEMFYFYHISHMAKHFLASGCGVRPFIDLWLMDNAKTNNDQKRREILERGQLIKFYKEIKKVADAWMNNTTNDSLGREIEEYVLQSGVYGTGENWVFYYQHKSGGKFRYALSRIFLSHQNLSRQFPILVKHKWLNPFFQIVRWFKILFSGGAKRSVNELKEIKNRPNEQVKQRENMMKELGLWN